METEYDFSFAAEEVDDLFRTYSAQQMKELFASIDDIDTSGYAASLEITINTDFVMTATLKNEDGNTLGTPQVVDLPLESVVVGGRYDSSTQNVILTLQNGNTVEFSVADLVSGLQSEITSTNKLSADLVNDSTSANKFVTAAEKAQIATNTSDIAAIQSIIGDINDVLEEVL